MSAVLSRFQKFVAPQPSGCWHWTGAKTAKGYGRFYLDGNKHAHRVAYELHKGAIPTGLVLEAPYHALPAGSRIHAGKHLPGTQSRWQDQAALQGVPVAS